MDALCVEKRPALQCVCCTETTAAKDNLQRARKVRLGAFALRLRRTAALLCVDINVMRGKRGRYIEHTHTLTHTLTLREIERNK
jgi:hypothetical protein